MNQRYVPLDPFDYPAYRSAARDDENYARALRDGARMILEDAVFPHPTADRARNVEHIGRLLDVDRYAGEIAFESSLLARRIVLTGSALYRRAFGKLVTFQALTAEEQAALATAERALAVGSDPQGGYAIPFTLDPTVILTSDLARNPLRAIARVERITGNEWRGVSSAGVTASYDAEATEVSDDTPTLAQPTANVEKAQVFIPFSIEVSQDWAGIQAELAKMTQDAKDRLEAEKFMLGAGHGSNEPEGLLTGATETFVTSGAGAVVDDDIYAFSDDLPERWQPGAEMIGSRFFASTVRKLDANGGAALWARIGEGIPPRLLDYPFHIASYLDASLTGGSQLAVLGDFEQFLIVDRVGLSVEIVQHLMGTSRRPTGQRGFYAFWRNTTKVLAANAFRVLVVAT